MSGYPLVLLQYMHLFHVLVSNSENLPITSHSPIAFNDLPIETFEEQFRFAKEDIPLLVTFFNLPLLIKLPNRQSVDVNICWCILLRKLAFPVRLCDLELQFGIHRSTISRILSFMVNYILDHYSYLICLRKCHCVANSNAWKTAVFNAGSALTTCVGFIDGTTRAICRPKKHQKKLYNGHKRYHCIKFQAVTMPNGLIMDLAGPFIGIRHDCRMVLESGINNKLNYCLQETEVIYGDPAYGLGNHIVCPYEHANLLPNEIEFNRKMAGVRISVEWGFGRVVSLFKGLHYGKHWKLFLQPVGLYYKAGAILTNVHACLYGNEISHYFGNQMTMEEYFHICNDCIQQMQG